MKLSSTLKIFLSMLVVGGSLFAGIQQVHAQVKDTTWEEEAPVKPVEPTGGAEGVLLDKIIGKVDNHILLKSEFDIAYLQYISNEKATVTGQTRCQILENLVINKLLLAKAELDSVSVEDRMVDGELERRMQYFINQIGSREKLERYFSKSIVELKADLRRQVKEQMIIEKMQREVTAKVKVTPGEVKKYFSQLNPDSLPFFSKEVEIGVILKLPQVGRSQKAETRQKLIDFRSRILAGESFSKLARLYSEDPGSAVKGGELGYFKKGDLVPPYEAAALKMSPGEISEPVESEFGFHLIQLIDKRGNEFNTRHILIKPGSSELDVDGARVYLDSLRRKIVSDSISFEKAAKEYSDDKATKENGGMMFDPSTKTNRVPAESVDPALFFIVDTMKVGSVTMPMPYRTDDGKEAYRLIYYKAFLPPHQANLKDDYQKIYNASLQEKSARYMRTWFQKTRGEVFIDIDPEFKDCHILKDL